MPNKNSKISAGSFNLINKEVSLKQNVKSEVNWYSILNILFLVVISSVGLTSFIFGQFVSQDVNLKKQQLVDFANTNVNVLSKSEIKAKINTLNDKFSIYEDVSGQNFDFNQFYNDFKKVYPSAQVKKITYRPDGSTIGVDVTISTDGYNQLPKFIDALKESPRFSKTTIKSVTFLTSEATTTTTNDIGVELTIDIPKTTDTTNG